MNRSLILAISIIVCLAFSSNGQSSAHKKELRKQERLDRALGLRRLLQSQHFSIDNFQLFDRDQNTKLLSASNNFLMFTGDDLIFQTSFSNTDGINGLGGLTLQGKIIDHKISDVGQKGPINLQVLFSSKTLGHTTLNINFYNDNTCRTQLSGLGGLEVFLLGNVQSNNAGLATNLGVPSF